MSFVRVKWLKSGDGRLPYMYLVESYRMTTSEGKSSVRQRILQYLGPGVPLGWEGQVPGDAHPYWKDASRKARLQWTEDQYVYSEHQFNGSTRWRRGPVVHLSNGDKVKIYADNQFWLDDQSKARLLDYTVTLEYSIRRLPPGFFSNVENVHLLYEKGFKFNVAGSTMTAGGTWHRDGNIMIHGVGAPWHEASQGFHNIESIIPHEVGHGYREHRNNQYLNKTLEMRDKSRLELDEYERKNRHTKDDEGGMWNDYWKGHNTIYTKYEKKREAYIKRNPIAQFDTISFKEGPLTSYAAKYWKEAKDSWDEWKAALKARKKAEDKYHKDWEKLVKRNNEIRREGDQDKKVAHEYDMHQRTKDFESDKSIMEGKVSRHEYDYLHKLDKFGDENFAEALEMWYGASSDGSAATGIAETHPRTFKKFSQIANKESKGWVVPIKDKPPAADKVYWGLRHDRERADWYRNIVKWEAETKAWKKAGGKPGDGTAPDLPYQPVADSRSLPTDHQRRKANLMYYPEVKYTDPQDRDDEGSLRIVIKDRS